MLGMLMCSGRTAFDDDVSSPSSRSRLKRSLSASASGRSPKARIAKGSIGGPFDFKHQAHMGFDELSGSESRWDMNRWQRELEARSIASTQRTPQTPNFVIPQEFGQPSLQATGSSNLARSPTASTATSTGRGVGPPRAPVKRKPAPTVEPVVSELTSTPIAALYSQRRNDPEDVFWNSPITTTPAPTASAPTSDLSQPQEAQPQKVLVPLLDPPALPSRKKTVPGEPTSTHYVTQTAKIRWDGAMAEIERALKEDPLRPTPAR